MRITEVVPVHYAPGDVDVGICGLNGMVSALPELVAGCCECLQAVQDDIDDQDEHRGRCLHCRMEISAQGGVAWRRAVRRPCPHCGRRGW